MKIVCFLAGSLIVGTYSLVASAAPPPPPPPTETGTQSAASPPDGLIGGTGTPPPKTITNTTTTFLKAAVSQSSSPPANAEATIKAFEISTTNDTLGLNLAGAEVYTPEQALVLIENLSIKDANLPAYDIQDNQIAVFNKLRDHMSLAQRPITFYTPRPFNKVSQKGYKTLHTKSSQHRLNYLLHKKIGHSSGCTIDNQLKEISQAGSDEKHYANKYFWGQFLFGHRERRSPINLASYESTSVGLVIGKDLIVKAQEIFGFFVGYQRTDQDKHNRGENEIRQFSGGLYGSITRDITNTISPYFSFMSAVQIARLKDHRRTVGTFSALRAHSNYRTYNALASGETGVKLETRFAEVSPYAQGSFTSIFKASHTERNGGDAGLTVHKRRMYLSSTELGIEISRHFYVRQVRLTPSSRAGWSHQRLLKGRNFRVSYPKSVATYDEKGSTRQKNLYTLEAKTSATNVNGYGVSLYINGRYGRKFRSNDFGAQVSKSL